MKTTTTTQSHDTKITTKEGSSSTNVTTDSKNDYNTTKEKRIKFEQWKATMIPKFQQEWILQETAPVQVNNSSDVNNNYNSNNNSNCRTNGSSTAGECSTGSKNNGTCIDTRVYYYGLCNNTTTSTTASNKQSLCKFSRTSHNIKAENNTTTTNNSNSNTTTTTSKSEIQQLEQHLQDYQHNHTQKKRNTQQKKKQLPDGIFYMRNFLSQDDEDTILNKIIDCNDTNTTSTNNTNWATVIARRQQFYGDIYYHTKHDVPEIQPIVQQQSSTSTQSPQSTSSVLLQSELSVLSKPQSELSVLSKPQSRNIQCMDWIIQKLHTINQYVPNSKDGYFLYHNKLMYYYCNPIGVFTAIKSTTPIIVNASINDNNNNTTKKTSDILVENKKPTDKVRVPDSCSNTQIPLQVQGHVPVHVEDVNQVLVNEYRGTIGISSHIDDPYAFGQVLVMISLNDPIIMRLIRTTSSSISLANSGCNGSNNTSNNTSQDDYYDEIHLLLEPRSVLILKGQARFEYEHAITKYKWIVVNHNVTSTNVGIHPNDENDNDTDENDTDEIDNTEFIKCLKETLTMDDWYNIVATCANTTRGMDQVTRKNNSNIVNNPSCDNDDNNTSNNSSANRTINIQDKQQLQKVSDCAIDSFNSSSSSCNTEYNNSSLNFYRLTLPQSTKQILENNNNQQSTASTVIMDLKEEEQQEQRKPIQHDLFIYERDEINYRRVSLTVRHLLDGRKQVAVAREYVQD